MTAINPRLEFKLKTLQNWAMCLAGFALWAVLVSPFPFRWIADAIGAAVAYYLLFFVLDKRTYLIRCPSCSKQVSTSTPWVCGVCKKSNLRVEDYPFTHKCEGCGIEPKAYKCHHGECGELIFFTEDKQDVNFAYCLNPKEQAPPPDKHAERAEEKAEKAHKIQMAKLAAELDDLRKQRKLEKQKEKTPEEAIQESLQNTYHKFIGVETHAKRQKALIDEEFKNDPEMRQKAHEVIDAWVRERI